MMICYSLVCVADILVIDTHLSELGSVTFVNLIFVS